jgi:leader peptidase (prepilin peptidase) / N-methyltransferase
MAHHPDEDEVDDEQPDPYPDQVLHPDGAAGGCPLFHAESVGPHPLFAGVRCRGGGAATVRSRDGDVTGVLIGGCALLGLAVGSFLNVVIYRVPRKESVVRPRSACPKCGTPIKERDNIPVVSWMLLRGRCRQCRATISARYPIVESFTAVLFVLAAIRFGRNWALPAYLVLLAALLALACTDLELYLLPKRIIYPALAMVSALLLLAAVATGDWHRLLIAVASGAVAFGLFFTINFINPRWMAFGDVRLALLIGVGLGWLGGGTALLGFFLGFLLGAVIGIGLILTKRITRKAPVPFGVFLAAGAAVAIYVAEPILRWYRPS